MSSNTKWDMAGASFIGSAKVTIASATTTTFDFGADNDINLANSGYKPGDRVLAVLSASTAGSTSNLTWVIQDANDSSGSFGTAATAVTSFITGALAATTGDDYSVAAIEVQPNRPWLRFKVTSDGTDSFVTHVVVLGIPSNL